MCQQLFQKLKNLMRPYSVTFESPLELSAQGENVCCKPQNFFFAYSLNMNHFNQALNVFKSSQTWFKSSLSFFQARRWSRCTSTSVCSGFGRPVSTPNSSTTKICCDRAHRVSAWQRGRDAPPYNSISPAFIWENRNGRDDTRSPTLPSLRHGRYLEPDAADSDTLKHPKVQQNGPKLSRLKRRWASRRYSLEAVGKLYGFAYIARSCRSLT